MRAHGPAAQSTATTARASECSATAPIGARPRMCFATSARIYRAGEREVLWTLVQYWYF